MAHFFREFGGLEMFVVQERALDGEKGRALESYRSCTHSVSCHYHCLFLVSSSNTPNRLPVKKVIQNKL